VADLPHTLILSPVGDIPPWVMTILMDRLPGIFGFSVRMSSRVDNLDFAHDTDRNQYHSTPILDILESLCPGDGIKILGITKEDLFIPILTHVYGEAQLGGRAAVVSISRLMAGPDLGGVDAGASRILKEATHELGHCFDLRHCEDKRCIMHYCRKLDEVDKKSSQFCRYCKIMMADYIRDAGIMRTEK